MIIHADTPDCFIEIAKEEDGYHFCVRAQFEKYALENDYLVFETPQHFVESLKHLEQTRTGRAELKGTEDFFMSFEPDGATGAIWVQLYLEKNFLGARHRAGGKVSPGIATLKGGFSISGEYVSSVVHSFSNLFAGALGYSGTIDLRKTGGMCQTLKLRLHNLKARMRNWLRKTKNA